MWRRFFKKRTETLKVIEGQTPVPTPSGMCNMYDLQESQALACAAQLQNTFLFRDLSIEELKEIAKISYMLECPAQYTLIHEGAENQLLYLIIEGQVAIFRNKQFVKNLGPGDHFGEMALLNSVPRTASVVTSKPSSLLVVERKRFVNLICSVPDMGLKIVWEMAKQLSVRLDEVMQKSFDK